LQIAAAEQVVEAAAQFGTDVNPQAVGFQKDAAAVLQAEDQLQFAVAGIAANDLVDFGQTVRSMSSLVNTDDQAAGVARIELVERDQFVDEQVDFVAAAAVAGAADQTCIRTKLTGCSG
jgi:hypothetical protein